MLATSAYLVGFRILHILAGVAWAGSVFMIVAFIQPSSAAIGPAAAPFLLELLGTRKLVDRIIAIGAVTIVAGGFLYWHDWQLYGSLSGFTRSRFGLALTIGGLAAIAAFLIGVFGSRPTTQRLVGLGRQLVDSEGAPPPEVAAEIPRQQHRLKILARLSFVLLVIAVIAMSTARYWLP
jgi:uncharacterized membrane protein